LTTVIKITGKFIEERNLHLLSKLLKKEIERGDYAVVVHGGGREITEEFKTKGIEAKFIDGLRVTGKEEIGIVEMVLSGKVNKRIVGFLLKEGIPAVGISGKDGRMVVARLKDERLGYVGEVERVDTKLIDILLENRFVPVVSPIAISISGETLNINGDTFASNLSISIRAERLVIITDVAGVMDEKGNFIRNLTLNGIEDLIERKVAKEGMIPKLLSASFAVKGGVPEVIIGTFKDGMDLNIEGTIIRREDDEES